MARKVCLKVYVGLVLKTKWQPYQILDLGSNAFKNILMQMQILLFSSNANTFQKYFKYIFKYFKFYMLAYMNILNVKKYNAH